MQVSVPRTSRQVLWCQSLVRHRMMTYLLPGAPLLLLGLLSRSGCPQLHLPLQRVHIKMTLHVQFWYTEETAGHVARECVEAAGPSGRIACIACPSLFRQLRAQFPDANTYLFEVDLRFEVGSWFTMMHASVYACLTGFWKLCGPCVDCLDVTPRPIGLDVSSVSCKCQCLTIQRPEFLANK